MHIVSPGETTILAQSTTVCQQGFLFYPSPVGKTFSSNEAFTITGVGCILGNFTILVKNNQAEVVHTFPVTIVTGGRFFAALQNFADAPGTYIITIQREFPALEQTITTITVGDATPGKCGDIVPAHDPGVQYGGKCPMNCLAVQTGNIWQCGGPGVQPIDCKWDATRGGGLLAFCFGGFKNLSDANGAQVQVSCTDNSCRGVQNLPTSPAGVIDGVNTSCVAGNLTNDAIESVTSYLNNQASLCKGLVTAGAIAGSLETFGVTVKLQFDALPDKLAACEAYSSSYNAKIRGTVTMKDGSSCVSEFPINIDINGTATLPQGAPGASPGTVIGQTPQKYSQFTVKYCTVAGTAGSAGGNGLTGIQTAIGCIPTSPTLMVGFFLTIAIGIAGGIAFLLIILGGMKILTSAGNPEAMGEGREIITSAIVGLLLIIFSIFLLRLIGVDILGIPSFS